MSIPQLQFPVPNGMEQYQQYRKLSAIALKMQQAGWRVDKQALALHRDTATVRYDRFRALFMDTTGVTDLGEDGGTDAVKHWFWETKSAPLVSIDKKTKKPKLDINGALMHYLLEIDDPQLNKAAAALIGLRKAAKTITFCEEYDTPTGRVHPTFNVTGTKGSRWSSSKPNIQQVPSKLVKYDFGDGPEPVAVSLKNCFIADEGFVLIGADYSALELYLQTYLAGAKRLLQWIGEGRDLHLANAQVILGEGRVPDGATKKTHKIEREVAKLLYGFAYCAGDHVATTAKQMRGKMPELTERMVKEFHRRYFGFHAEFPRWQDATINKVKTQGFIEIPPMNRRLYLEASNRGFNQSLNAQPQILGGDLMNAAIIELDGHLNWPAGYQIRGQIHDSLVIQVPDTAADRESYARLLTDCMTRPTRVNGHETALVAEASVGNNWEIV